MVDTNRASHRQTSRKRDTTRSVEYTSINYYTNITDTDRFRRVLAFKHLANLAVLVGASLLHRGAA